jgi:hypothetical protein
MIKRQEKTASSDQGRPLAPNSPIWRKAAPAATNKPKRIRPVEESGGLGSEIMKQVNQSEPHWSCFWGIVRGDKPPTTAEENRDSFGLPAVIG